MYHIFLFQCIDFVAVGAKEMMTPSDVIGSADITFSCVSDPQVAKNVSDQRVQSPHTSNGLCHPWSHFLRLCFAYFSSISFPPSHFGRPLFFARRNHFLLLKKGFLRWMLINPGNVILFGNLRRDSFAKKIWKYFYILVIFSQCGKKWFIGKWFYVIFLHFHSL